VIDGDADAAEILATRVPARAWQRMLSGRRLDLLNPAPAEIELDDIAHGLARVARWNGQTQGPHVFSVAQHSLLVEAIAVELEPALDHAGRLAALLHDAPEYVIGDLITPLKGVIGDGYGRVEARLLAAVYRRFGLPGEPGLALHRLIKRADRVAACLEAMRLAGFTYAEADAVFGMPEIVPASADALLTPWPTDRAASAFRERVTILLGPDDAVRSQTGRLAQRDAS
jgi:5'-deoxynucleotidase YfbR-like HD superfamily hydrolase